MDDLSLGAVEWAIRHSMTAEQCVRIERLARATAASQALEALIGQRSSILPPRAGARIAARWVSSSTAWTTLASSGFAVVRRWAAAAPSTP